MYKRQDLVKWLQGTLLKIQLIPRPALVPGIIDMSEETVYQALKAVNSNIRLNTMKAILKPNEYIPNQYKCKKGRQELLQLSEPLDVSLVASSALQCAGTESLYDWYDDFMENRRLWNYEENQINELAKLDNEDDNNKKDGKKRTREEVDGENEKRKKRKESKENNLSGIARSRFMTSVNMLETIGLIKSKPTNYLVTRSIYTFTEEE